MEKEQTDALLDRLAGETMLITIVAKKWSGGKVDKTSAQTLADQHNGEKEGWGNAQMKLLPPDYKKELTKIGNVVGTSLQKHGIPLNGGYLIAVGDYAKVRSETDIELAELAGFVDKLIMDRQIIENWAATKLQDAYYDGIIPSDEELKQKFTQDVNVISLGKPSFSMGAAAEDAKNSMVKQYNDAMTLQVKALKDMVTDTKEIVQDVMTGDKQRFKTTRWERIKEQLNKVKAMNLNIVGLNDVCADVDTIIEAVKDYKASDIKEDPGKAKVLEVSIGGIESLLSAF